MHVPTKAEQLLFDSFPALLDIPVPTPPDHVNYDLRIPARAGRLMGEGDPVAPLIWWTWCRPDLPLTPHSIQPWHWLENGPVFWLVDIWWRRDLMDAREAMGFALDMAMGQGVLREGEPVAFWRNAGPGRPGRYGHVTARRRG